MHVLWCHPKTLPTFHQRPSMFKPLFAYIQFRDGIGNGPLETVFSNPASLQPQIISEDRGLVVDATA